MKELGFTPHFKFHYVSINSLPDPFSFFFIFYPLNSIMFLLIRIDQCIHLTIIDPLNSIMFLLIQIL